MAAGSGLDMSLSSLRQTDEIADGFLHFGPGDYSQFGFGSGALCPMATEAVGNSPRQAARNSAHHIGPCSCFGRALLLSGHRRNCFREGLWL